MQKEEMKRVIALLKQELFPYGRPEFETVLQGAGLSVRKSPGQDSRGDFLPDLAELPWKDGDQYSCEYYIGTSRDMNDDGTEYIFTPIVRVSLTASRYISEVVIKLNWVEFSSFRLHWYYGGDGNDLYITEIICDDGNLWGRTGDVRHLEGIFDGEYSASFGDVDDGASVLFLKGHLGKVSERI